MALILYRPIFWFLIVLAAALLFRLGKQKHLKWWPAWGTRLLLIIAAFLGIFFPRGQLLKAAPEEQEIFILDYSDSIAEPDRIRAIEEAKTWLANDPSRLVILSGVENQIVSTSTSEWPDVDGRGSNLPGALELAGNLLSASKTQKNHIILSTDGLAQDPGELTSVVANLGLSGLTLDILPLSSRSAAGDAYLDQILHPSFYWENLPILFGITIQNLASDTEPAPTFEVRINGETISTVPEVVGTEYYSFTLPAQPRGLITISVELINEGDSFRDNNIRYASVPVYPAPSALLVSTSAVTDFMDVLSRTGLSVELKKPQELSQNPSDLEKYQVIVLNNLLALELTTEQMIALRQYVSERQGSLIFLGGKNSYSLGGYENSVLETLLPIKLEPPERPERPPVIFTLVLDNSSSMGAGGYATREYRPVDLAKEAAMRAIDILEVNDILGVMVFSTSSEWIFPLQKIEGGVQLRGAVEAISAIRAFGGTNIFSALNDAVSAIELLPDSGTPNRVLLLLTDGKSDITDNRVFRSVPAYAREKGIFISTVGLGTGIEAEELRWIADAGGGRFYEAKNAEELPRILINESRAAKSGNIQTGETSLMPGEPDHPILSGLTGTDLPLVSTYNAVSSRSDEGAEDILVTSSFSDPILSVWQYGSGRVAAWTTEASGSWIHAWKDTLQEVHFWSRVIRYVLPNPLMGDIQAAVTEPGRLTTGIDIYIEDSDSFPVNFLNVSMVYSAEGGQPRRLTIPQSGPGIYQTSLGILPQGAYRSAVLYGSSGGPEKEYPVPFAVNYPEEWKTPTKSDIEQAAKYLTHGLSLANGTKITSLSETTNPARNWAYSLPDKTILLWILTLLLITWPVEIALRRRWLPWPTPGKRG